jgi:hypothetical protein
MKSARQAVYVSVLGPASGQEEPEQSYAQNVRSFKIAESERTPYISDDNKLGRGIGTPINRSTVIIMVFMTDFRRTISNSSHAQLR